MKMLLSLIFGLVAFAYGGVPTLNGPCQDFNPIGVVESKVIGDWFLVLQGDVGNGDTKPSINRCQKRSVSGKSGTFQDLVTYADGDGKPQSLITVSKVIEGTKTFSVTSDDIPANGITTVAGVLDTDNTNFLVVLYCFTDGSKHGYHVNVYGRQKTLAASFANRAREAVKSRNINANLKVVEQNC